MIFRIGEHEDIPDLVRMRIVFIRDIHPEYDETRLDEIADGTDRYFRNGYENGSYRGFLCLSEDGDLAGTAGILLYSLPPLSHGCPRSIGHLLNFFIDEKYRRKGYGWKLLEFVKDWASSTGVDRLVLNATDMGFGLYQQAGFIIPEDRAMILEMTRRL